MSFRIGDKVGDYKIVGVVGAGGAGQVFRVEHPITGRIEAMKVLLEGRGTETEAPAARFLREIKLQASLDHPNIASVHNAFWADDELVMIMELIQGVSFDRLIAEGQMPMGKVLRYAVQSLIALEYAHSRGITHRDIKPENIMVTPDGVVKLMDFGLAKDRDDPRMTELGVVVGSLFYISPEQARGLATVDHRADVYSFGSVLYEMTTGERPFALKTSYELLQAAVKRNPEPPSKLAPDIPPALEAVILRAMAKDPAERFQSAREFRRTIEAVVRNPNLDARPGRASPAPTQRRNLDIRKRARRQNRARIALLVASATVLAYLALRTIGGEPETVAADPVVEASIEAPPSTPETGSARGGFVLRETKRLDETARSLAFDPAGRLLAAGLKDGRVLSWNLDSGDRLAELELPSSGPVSIAVAQPRVAAVTDEGEALLWDVPGEAEPRVVTGDEPASFLRFSTDGQRLAVAAADGSIQVWDLEGNQSWSLRRSKRVPKTLAFSTTGPMMAVSDAGRIALWGVGLSDRAENLSAPGPEAEAIAFSANGLEMAAGIGSRVLVWDLPTRRRRRSYALSGTVRALAPAGGGWIALTSDSKRENLWVWRADKGRKITTIRLERPAVALALSSRGDRLACSNAAGEVHFWDSQPVASR